MVSVHVRPMQRAVARLRVRLVAIGLALLAGILLIGAGIVTIGIDDSRLVRVGAMGFVLVGVFLVLISIVRLCRPTAR